MASVGNVRIGSKNIDLQAFTGEVMDTAHSTYVETVRRAYAPGGWRAEHVGL